MKLKCVEQDCDGIERKKRAKKEASTYPKQA